ncbi:MAG TPA: hypothetical protein VMR44_03250 [Thermoanaerobaculia bacterium]|nr:hypothetical protein [Thermoanaerobaculia bacterium]
MAALRTLRPLLLPLAAWSWTWGCSGATPAEAPGAESPTADSAVTAAAQEGEQAPGDELDAGPGESGTEAEVGAASTVNAASGASVRTDPTVISIERPEREARPTTLHEAAAAARAGRAAAGPSKIAVTDDNLHEFQGEGVTFAESERRPQGEAAEGTLAEGAAAAPSGADGEPEQGEGYWRARVRDLRLGLREAVDELAELEGRAGSLRRSFYAEDDPYVRDGEIKPAWDRVLDRIGETREAIARYRDELEESLEEGRLAGALPGWLREGIELEPEEAELPAERERFHEPRQPEILDIREPPGG